MSRENYTPEEVGLFAKENGYVIHSLNQRKVDLRGETYIYANTLTMLPKGEDPDLVRGHSNPVNEPYKTICKIIQKGIRKGVNENGMYVCDFSLSGITLDNKAQIHEVVNAHNCTWTQYKKNTQLYTSGYRTILEKVYCVGNDKLSEYVLTKSFKDITYSGKLKTGAVRLDPDQDVWEDDIVWTGEIVGGKLTGKGRGAKLFDKDSKRGLVIEGIFEDGRPAEKVLYRYGKVGEDYSLSLYGQNNVFDDEHKNAGVSISIMPTDDAGVYLIERSRVTGNNGSGVHNTRWGYVDSSFNTICWVPINSEIVQPLKNGKIVIRHRKRGKDNPQGIIYTLTDELDYEMTLDGHYSLNDDALLAQYDAIMANWREIMGPYDEDANSHSMPNLWKMESEWDRSLEQIDCNLLTEEPLDIVKSKRSNYNRFEILKQLSKLNELIYTETVSLFDSYISSHPNYMYNIRERANIIMKSLTDNQDFNPPYMEKVFNQYSRILDENVEDYGRLYYKIVGKPSSDTYNRYDRNRILNSIVSKSSWKSLGNGDMEMVVKFNDGKEVTVCYSPGKEQNECSYYVPSKIIGRDWYATLDDAIVAAYRKAW